MQCLSYGLANVHIRDPRPLVSKEVLLVAHIHSSSTDRKRVISSSPCPLHVVPYRGFDAGRKLVQTKTPSCTVPRASNGRILWPSFCGSGNYLELFSGQLEGAGRMSEKNASMP